MAGFGSEGSPFNEAFGRIIEVHWKKKDPPVCEGETTITGFWGTLEDNSHSEGTGGGGGGGLTFQVIEAHGLFMGVWNTSERCHALYEISASVTRSDDSGIESTSYSGTLGPGGSFIIGIVAPGFVDDYRPPAPGALPSLDVWFPFGFGNYRYLEASVWTMTFPP